MKFVFLVFGRRIIYCYRNSRIKLLFNFNNSLVANRYHHNSHRSEYNINVCQSLQLLMTKTIQLNTSCNIR